jgi:hypothetical protein
MNSTGPLPTGTGGVIAEATYFLSAVTRYNAPSDKPSGMTWQVVMVLGGGKFDILYTGGSLVQRASGTWVVSGNTVPWSQTCPESSAWVDTYEATPRQLKLYSSAWGGNDYGFVYDLR